ncbi:ABC transporter substrate-binding protein [Inquilinus limosus]|uniref:ABC transporter substrate-binding protein n=1 Tax=Inquilinus limosus TaxID=171674 RepID=UPI0004149484|nr:extracellular solute-binding protein [Inquilinus limosus]
MQALTRRSMVAGAAMLTAAFAAGPGWGQEAPSKPVTIEFFGLASHNWPLVIERFQADYPTVTVHLTKFGTDELKQALRVAAASGKLPDAWWNWGGSLASPYNRAGHALKLTPELLTALGVEANVTTAALDITRDGADLYGIPNKIGPFGFIYKKALFDKYGLQPPQSFAELEKVAETLKANGVTPFSIGGKFSWMTMRFFDFFLEHYAGAEGHDALLDMRESWESEPVIQSFAKLKEWADKGYFPDGFLNVDPATNMPLLYNDQAAMVFDTPSLELSRIMREGKSPADYGTFPLPTDRSPKRVPGSPSQIQVNAKSPEDVRKAALLFASYVVRPEIAPVTAQAVGFPSATKDILPAEDLPIQRQWSQWTQGEIGFYRLTDQGLPQDVVAAYFEAQDSVLLDLMTPEEAAAQVQEAIERSKTRASN